MIMLAKMAQNTEETARRENLINLLDYYNFNRPALEKEIGQWINRKESDIPFSLTNLTKKIVNRKSVVYKKPAIRTIGKNQIKYEEATANKDSNLKTIERRVNLLGRVAVRPIYDDKFRYQIIQYFLPTKINSGKVEELVYPIDTPLVKEPLFSYWSLDEHYICDVTGKPIKDQEQYGVNPKMMNPYGIIPFAFPFSDNPVEGFWVDGAEDIVETNQKVNLGLTLLNYLMRYSSFKQPYVKGYSVAEDEIQAGYAKFMSLEGGGAENDIGVIDIEANLSQIVDSIKTQIELCLHNNNLSMRWGGSGSATSGFQIIVENIDLLTMWEDMVDVWRENERELFEVEKAVLETDAGISVGGDIQVDFAEVKFPVSKEEQRTQDEWDLKHGLISPLDILKRRSPDTPEEKLKQILQENSQQKLELEPKNKPVGLAERLKGLSNA